MCSTGGKQSQVRIAALAPAYLESSSGRQTCKQWWWRQKKEATIKAGTTNQLILLSEVEALKDEYDSPGREGISNGRNSRNKGMRWKGQGTWENRLACVGLYIWKGMSQRTQEA